MNHSRVATVPVSHPVYCYVCALTIGGAYSEDVPPFRREELWGLIYQITVPFLTEEALFHLQPVLHFHFRK